MGANQSAGRPGPKSIPVRPRTPLRFGSVPTPMPVNPYDYNTRPVRNLYANMQFADSVTSMLSQENYLNPSPAFSSPGPDRMTEDSGSSIYSSPSPSPSFEAPRYVCSYPNCAYSVIGYDSPEELDMHLAEGRHFSSGQQMMQCEPEVYGWSNQQIPTLTMQPQVPQYPSTPQQSCPCQYCVGYQQDVPIYPAGHQVMHVQMPLPPTIVGYNGPEVENLSWQEGQTRPQGAYPTKRARIYY